LYNTLNTIKSLAYLQGIENIQSVSNALLDMLHLNLDKRTYISIAEEKAYLQQYITIQEYRYVDKFSYRIDVDEEVEDYLIPKCIVQPIVENALQHGIVCTELVGYSMIEICSGHSCCQLLMVSYGVLSLLVLSFLLPGIFHTDRQHFACSSVLCSSMPVNDRML
jgi:LytS/YehU family sensor histidine kinase